MKDSQKKRFIQRETGTHSEKQRGGGKKEVKREKVEKRKKCTMWIEKEEIEAIS